MKLSRLFIAVTFGIGLSTCATPQKGGLQTFDAADVTHMRDGDVVRARGYLVFESHARQLWSSPDAYKSGDFTHCITLIDTQPHQRELSAKNRTFVTVTGRVRADVISGYVDLGACNRAGVTIERID